MAPGRARPLSLCPHHLPRHPSCAPHPAGVSRGHGINPAITRQCREGPGVPCGVPVPHDLTCSKSRRVCVWARGPISRSRRRHVCTKGSGWGWAPGGPPDALGSVGTGSSSPSPHSPSWEAGREQGRAAVRRAKWLLHNSCISEERRDRGIPQGPESCWPSLGQ